MEHLEIESDDGVIVQAASPVHGSPDVEFTVPGLAVLDAETESEDASENKIYSEDSSFRRLNYRPTCGKMIMVRFKTLFVSTMVVILLLFCVSLILPITIQMNHLVHHNEGAFQYANSASTEAIVKLLKQLASTMGHRIGYTANPSRAFVQTEQAVNGLWNAFRGLQSGEDGGSSDGQHWVKVNGTSYEPINWVETIAPFLYPSIQSSMYTYVKHVYVAYADNGLFGLRVNRSAVSLGARLNPVHNSNIQLVYSQENITDSVKSLRSVELDPSTGEPDWETSTLVATSWNKTVRPWYQNIYDYSVKYPNGTEKGAWTTYFNFTTMDYESGGVTFAYPLAPACGKMGCLKGVIGADLGVETLNRMSCEQLLDAASGMKDKSCVNPNSHGEYMSLSYVLLTGDQKGVVLGNSFDGAPSGEEYTAQMALTHSQKTIRQAARFVTNNVTTGKSDVWGQVYTVLKQASTVEPTTWVVNLENQTLCNVEDLFEDGTYNQDKLLGCYLVVLTGTESLNASYFNSFNPIATATIAVLPYSAFLEGIPQTIQTSIELFLQGRKRQQESLSKDLIRNTVLSLVFVAVGAVVAIVLAYAIDRPLQVLRNTIRKLNKENYYEQEGGPTDLETGSRIIEILEVQQTLETLRSTVSVFGKFVPKAVVKGIVRNKPNARSLHVRQRVVTVLFSDIANFTTTSERLRPKDLMILLTKYLTVMTKIIESYEGVVGEILGDGILVYWNTPTAIENHEALACACALAQQASMAEINREFKPMFEKYDLPPLKIRVGIHTGNVLTGNIGSSSKMKFGCLGDTINLASRVEALCKRYGAGIMCTDSTFIQLVPDMFQICELDLISINGSDTPIRVYEVISMPGCMDKLPTSEPRTSRTENISSRKKKQSKLFPNVLSIGPIDLPTGQHNAADDINVYITHFTKALRLYQAGNFEDAQESQENVPYKTEASIDVKQLVGRTLGLDVW
eukprot:CAMPEP_0203746550 /NCGR_PEP_ID=MMETSP0098-20131031/1955_1 /ASSEMBLY_ACC=CAM_ASM_000208 /TAXON_ID=96639 /ORGANISM=" , Strain NY0313808BC1" /LENGTH=964 /DNA_ID=CAMNT_0050634685 /DNA_START=3850 /DNA_END=6741 /DNA_ORIENTATION=+